MRVCGFVVALLGCSCCAVQVPLRAGAAASSGATAALVLDTIACELPTVAATCCERATNLSEWRALRHRLGGAAATLPDSWCDFGAEAVVAVATAAGPAQLGFECTATEEEGVDVLTLTQEHVAAGAARSWGLIVKTARRPAQLAVVLRHNGP